MHEINRLDQQVVNQIAAGEVVERPASIVKELIENSLDAGATSIELTVEDGGLSRIEIRDNGKGIAKDDLSLAFERYATSKLHSTDDLQHLLSYGFRGEALAAISSVSKTTLLSSRGGEAYTLTVEQGNVSAITPGSRAQGTTIVIEQLFETVPARRKFLKSAETEYRYILNMFTNFALLNGNVHFILTHNTKQIYNFPVSATQLFPRERVAKVYAVSENDLLEVAHEEYGIRIAGFVLHPKLLGSNSKFLVTYVNNRPVEDKAFYKAVLQGIAGYVPDFFKPSAILSISLDPTQVDVNVHPRKTEVKLMNPFRIYAAVTHAVKATLQTNIAQPDRERVAFKPVISSPTSQSSFTTWDKKQDIAYDRLRGSQPTFHFGENSSFQGQADDITNFQDSLLQNNAEKPFAIPQYLVDQARNDISQAQIVPILGRYIVVGFLDEVWIIDQHAAAERVRYEQFTHAYLEGETLPQQQLLVPITINLTEAQKLVLKEHGDFFPRLGFSVQQTNNSLQVTSVPVFVQSSDLETLLQDAISELVEHVDVLSNPVIEDFSSSKSIGLVIATMACHNSVRMNERLSVQEARSIVTSLLTCHIPFACPHGRRVIWRMTKEEVDRQFMRT